MPTTKQLVQDLQAWVDKTQADLDRYYYERTERQREFKVAYDHSSDSYYVKADHNPYALAEQTYQLTPEERAEEMRRAEIVKQLGPKPDAQAQLDRWLASLRAGAPAAEILGVSINLKLDHEGHSTNRRHVAVMVRGYRILRVTLYGSDTHIESLACYSPLLKDLVGEPFLVDCGYNKLEFNPRWELYLSRLPDLRHGDVQPLTDMQSKRIVFYKHLSYDWYSTKQPAELYHRALHPHINPHWLVAELGCPDLEPELAAARYLRGYPVATQQKLWADFDNWGPIDNLYGAAMIHLDKFRSA